MPIFSIFAGIFEKSTIICSSSPSPSPDAEARGQNFGQVSNAFVRVVDENSQNELLRFDLGEDFSIETAVVVLAARFRIMNRDGDADLFNICGYF